MIRVLFYLSRIFHTRVTHETRCGKFRHVVQVSYGNILVERKSLIIVFLGGRSGMNEVFEPLLEVVVNQSKGRGGKQFKEEI